MATPISSTHPLPTGHWRWSSSGAPSSPGHPLAESRSFLPINWPGVVFFAPSALGWVLYVTGHLGESDGQLYKTWTNVSLAVMFALFPVCYWWAGDKVEKVTLGQGEKV